MMHTTFQPLAGVRRGAWWLLFVVGSLLFVLHFTFVQLMNMPMNPIKLAFYEPLDQYVNPYFSQNWSFFAPNPIADDLSTMVRGESVDRSGRFHVTPWYDVSDTLIDAAKGRPMSPIASISLALSNATVQYINHASKDKRTSFEAHGRRYVRTRLRTSIDPMDALIMRTIATSALESQYPSLTFAHVQLGIRSYEFPRFTERRFADDPAKGVLLVFGWHKTPVVIPLRGAR